MKWAVGTVERCPLGALVCAVLLIVYDLVLAKARLTKFYGCDIPIEDRHDEKSVPSFDRKRSGDAIAL
jgi:hypothetical protein